VNPLQHQLYVLWLCAALRRLANRLPTQTTTWNNARELALALPPICTTLLTDLTLGYTFFFTCNLSRLVPAELASCG
jgi:hypothetical protein